MARHPKPENARNPLRQLRALLSKNGESKPITQDRLSEICDIPTYTIRSIEAGRRKLSSSALKKIEEITTATWNFKRGQWTVYGSDKPLTFSWYSFHRHFTGQRPPNYQARIHFIHAKIDGLFDKIPERSWNLLSFRISDFLEECKRDFKLKDLDDVFYKAKVRHEEFLAFLRNQNLPKPMYSPTVLNAQAKEPRKRAGCSKEFTRAAARAFPGAEALAKRAKCSKAKSAGGQALPAALLCKQG